MESSGLSGVVFPGANSGMLSLEMPLQTQNPQNPQNPPNPIQFHPPPHMVSYAGDGSEHHTQTMKQTYPYAHKPKQASPISDEDDPASGSGHNPPDDDAKRKFSPWQRMKWTDTMVRLLIMAVFYIGDEAGSEPVDPATGKKKPGGGFLQKKGKWKSVSRAMMEKGFYVSPQQCEDKFNDLNKRYKRVNDILGRGTACRVVENQSLLDTMDLLPKMKEEARKLLNSKHLFFREMCAYHNSCGHLTANAGSSGQAHQPNQQQQGGQSCLHSSEAQPGFVHPGKIEGEGSKMVTIDSEDDDDDEDDDSDEDEEEDDDEEEAGSKGLHDHSHDDSHEHSSKRQKKGLSSTLPVSHSLNQLSSEASSIVQDNAKSLWEKKQWIKTRLIQLEEQGVRYGCEAYELEKQRVKWIKYSSRKEREMERAKLENERRRLENERMVLVIRQKELELLEIQQHNQHQMQQHSSNKKSDPSSITA